MPEPLTPRQKAGRENRKKWRGISPEGREKLRRSALSSRPWEHSTGPRTTEGKRISRANGLKHGGRAFAVLPEHIKDFILALREAERGEGPIPDTELAAVELALMDSGDLQLLERASRLALRYVRARQRLEGKPIRKHLRQPTTEEGG